MGSPFSKTKSKSESSRPSTQSRLGTAHDAIPVRTVVVTPKTSYSSRTTVQEQREQTRFSSVSRLSTTVTTSGSSVGTAAVRYSPVYKRPSLSSPPDALRMESSPRIGQEISDKYDLSKNAHVLVFHHNEFKDKLHNRQGSTHDMDKIRAVLKNYRTDPLKVHTNCSLLSVRRVMDAVSEKDFSKNSCLIVFIMSHGQTQDTIMAYDGQMYSFQDDIVEKCTSNASLRGKPKIFILQACRGTAFMQIDSTTKTLSEKFDTLTFQSTYQGTVSFRDKEKGSFFMQNFLTMLQQYGNIDIKEVNTYLNRRFNEQRISQTPTITSTLQKTLIFGDLLKSR